jgi:hypothetical protein
MSLSRSDMHDVADGDVSLFRFSRNPAFPCRDDENLVAIVHVPTGGRADAEIDHVAAEIVRLPVADDRLPSPAHRSPRPSGDRRRSVHRFLLKLADFEYTHDIFLSFTGPNYTANADTVKRTVNSEHNYPRSGVRLNAKSIQQNRDQLKRTTRA